LISSGVVQRLSFLFEKPCQKLFALPGSFSAALILGALGGYPMGARTVATLYQQGFCSRENAERALFFCNNAGPAFLIGVIGSGLLGRTDIGWKLYGIHLFASLLLGFFQARNKGAVKTNCLSACSVMKQTDITLFLQSVTASLTTFLNVCAFVLIFAVLSCLLQQLPLWSLLQRLPGGGTLWYGMLSGILELTAGVSALTQSYLSMSILLPAVSFLCGWGGWSIHFQAISILQETNLSFMHYLKGKLLHGLLAALLTALLLH